MRPIKGLGVLLSAVLAASVLSPLAAGAALAASTATGNLAVSLGIGATSMPVNLTSACLFAVTRGSNGPGDIVIAGVDVGPALTVTAVQAGQQVITLRPTTGYHFAADAVTQANVPNCGAPAGIGAPVGLVFQGIPAGSACVDVIRTGSLPFVIPGVLSYPGGGAETVPIYNVQPVGTSCYGGQVPGVQGITTGATKYPHAAGLQVTETVGTPTPDQLSVDLAFLWTQFAVCERSGPGLAFNPACYSFLVKVALLWLIPTRAR